MFVVIILIGFVAIAGVAAYLKYKARQDRIRAVTAVGRRVGFTFSEHDVERLVDMPFALFRRGDGRGVELILSGTHDQLPMRLFDFWYYETTSDGRGGQSRTYHRFTCAMVHVAFASPHLRVGHEGFFSKLGSHMGLRDIEFEYDEFNQRFRVKCDDQKFAFSLFDGQMMQWLLDHDSFDTIEIVGPFVLMAVGRLAPARWLDLGTWLEQFHGHIPAVVYSTYPTT